MLKVFPHCQGIASSSKRSYCHLLPETSFPPACWSRSQLTMPVVGRNSPSCSSVQEHLSHPLPQLDLERDVSTRCQHQIFNAVSSFGLCWMLVSYQTSNAPGIPNFSTTHSSKGMAITHTQRQGKAGEFCPETVVCHNKHCILPLLCSSSQIK